MSCEEISFLISLYLDDELTVEERVDLDAHLDGCPECRAELTALQQSVALSASVPDLLPPVDLRDRILASTIYRRSLWQRAWDGFTRPAVWRASLATAAVASALLVALNVGQRDRVSSSSDLAQESEGISKSTEWAQSRPNQSEEIPGAETAPALESPQVAAAPEEEPNGLQRFIDDIRDTVTRENRSAPRPNATRSPVVHRDPAPRVVVKNPSPPRPNPNRSVAVVHPPKTVPPAPRDAMARVDRVRQIFKSRKPPASRLPVASSSNGNSTPDTSPFDSPETNLLVSEPRRDYGGVIEPSAAEVLASAADAEIIVMRPENPIQKQIIKMAQPAQPKKLDPVEETLNLIDSSALSTARQVKWNLGKIKF